MKTEPFRTQLQNIVNITFSLYPMMESSEYKENHHYNRKQNRKDSDRVERKKALKKFKKINQRKENERPRTQSDAETDTNPSANHYRANINIGYTRLKVDEDFSLIRNLVKKKGHKMIRPHLPQGDDDYETNSKEKETVALLPKKKKLK